MSQLWSGQNEIQHLAAAVGRPGRSRAGDLGCRSPTQQIAELPAHVDDIDFDAAADYERQLAARRDGPRPCLRRRLPDGRPIIHLGATSCFVTDNTDLILLREALAAGRERGWSA